MNRSVVKLAETREKQQQEDPEKCTMLFVLNAVKLVRYRLNRRKAVRCTAVNASQSSAKKKTTINNPVSRLVKAALIVYCILPSIVIEYLYITEVDLWQ